MIRFTPAISAVAAIVVAIMVVAYAGQSSGVALVVAAAGLIIIASMTVAPGGATIVERIVRRRRFRHRDRRRGRGILYGTSGAGTVWNGEATSMYVELGPPPWAVTVTDSPRQNIAIEPLPLETIRQHLVQGDIGVDSITALGWTHRPLADGGYDSIYADTVGETSVPTSNQCLLEVSVNLEHSYQSVLARATKGSTPAGIGKTAHIVARRLEQQLRIGGFHARLLSSSPIHRFHDEVLDWLNDGFRNEKWTHLGGAMPTVAAKPTRWTPEAVERWFTAPAERIGYAFTVRNDRYQRTHLGGILTYTAANAKRLPEGPLRVQKVDGAHGDAATALLPLAATTSPRHNELVVGGDDTLMVPVPSYGLGVLLGPTEDGGRAWLNATTGGAALYVAAPAGFLQQLAARMSATGLSVGIHIDDDGFRQLADNLTPRHGIPRIIVEPAARTHTDVAIYKNTAPSKVPATTAAIIWCPAGVPDDAEATLTADDTMFTITTPRGQVQFKWETPRREAEYIPGLLAAV